jgi:hypothetical protein
VDIDKIKWGKMSTISVIHSGSAITAPIATLKAIGKISKT